MAALLRDSAALVLLLMPTSMMLPCHLLPTRCLSRARRVLFMMRAILILLMRLRVLRYDAMPLMLFDAVAAATIVIGFAAMIYCMVTPSPPAHDALPFAMPEDDAACRRHTQFRSPIFRHAEITGCFFLLHAFAMMISPPRDKDMPVIYRLQRRPPTDKPCRHAIRCAAL